MAAAAGKKSTTSLSLFMEACGIVVEEELATSATQYWAEGVWTGKWHHEQREASMRQVREVQMWRQVRGLAGVVMCETRDLGVNWPHWHTLIWDLFAQNVKNMLLQHAGTVCWKKWAAKHEYEYLKEGFWLEPALALFRKKTKEAWEQKAKNSKKRVEVAKRYCRASSL